MSSPLSGAGRASDRLSPGYGWSLMSAILGRDSAFRKKLPQPWSGLNLLLPLPTATPGDSYATSRATLEEALRPGYPIERGRVVRLRGNDGLKLPTTRKAWRGGNQGYTLGSTLDRSLAYESLPQDREKASAFTTWIGSLKRDFKMKLPSSDRVLPITQATFAMAVSKNGGFNKAQLSVFGIPFPPAKGWKKKLIGTSASEQSVQLFISLKG